MKLNDRHDRGRHRRRRHAFTLAELLVVMGIIAILAALTVVAVGAIADDARLATGRNLVTTVLDNGRSLAMQRNKPVLVVFRPVLVAQNEQRVEAILAEWTGESYQIYLEDRARFEVVDRFRPIPDAPARRLPRGIKVAGPSYGASSSSEEDFVWETQAHLPAINQDDAGDGTSEIPGRMIGVMFGPDGRTMARNLESDSDRMFVDFDDFDLDRRRIQTISNVDNNRDQVDYTDVEFQSGRAVVIIPDNANFSFAFFNQQYAEDEPFVSISPFLAVFDDAEARDIRVLAWNSRERNCQGTEGYEELVGSECPNSEYFLRGYINDRADRIHFNRYTGVIMR